MTPLTIVQIQQQIDEKRITYADYVNACIDRIRLMDGALNAISELNPNAVEQAAAMDKELMASGRRSMLHGIPVLIKDNINIGSDDLHTTAGAYVFKDLIAPYDAHIVEQLRKAGAVILGKTNLSEFANFISEDSPNGFSALKGQVKNPFGEFDVGGSSSGSGVAAACDYCPVTIGTETSGSIISPASSNGVIGLKPTVGSISRYGIIPISATQDVPGPIGKSVGDLRLVLQLIEGFDSRDLSTKGYQKLGDDRWTKVGKVELAKLRLGVYVLKEYKNDPVDENRVFMEAAAKLKSAGVCLRDVDFNEDDYKVDWDVLYYEFPRDMADYLATVKGHVAVTDLKAIVDYNRSNLETYVPYDQKQFETCLMKADAFNQDYGRALKDSYRYGGIMDRWIEEHELDAVCFVNCDAIDISARRGHPSITIPIGATHEGKPVGFTMTGPMFSEPKLLSIAERLMDIIGEFPALPERAEG